MAQHCCAAVVFLGEVEQIERCMWLCDMFEFLFMNSLHWFFPFASRKLQR